MNKFLQQQSYIKIEVVYKARNKIIIFTEETPVNLNGVENTTLNTSYFMLSAGFYNFLKLVSQARKTKCPFKQVPET